MEKKDWKKTKWKLNAIAVEYNLIERIDKIEEELEGLLDKAREEGRKEVINELNDLDDVEKNDEFRQYKVWAKYLIEQLSKLKDNK